MKTHVWTLNETVVVSMLHILAIVTGLFRTFYRWYVSRFWWEDVWATIALLLDIVCLVCVWVLQSHDLIAVLWMEAIILTSGLWAARMSMITTIIRITNHHVLFKRYAYATVVAFGVMWVAVLTQKLYDCNTRTCYLKQDVVMSQLVTDVISDTLLMILPLTFLRGVQLERGQRISLVSSFASSICITIISITHSVFLLLPFTSVSDSCSCQGERTFKRRSRMNSFRFFSKTALALMICNLLVIVTFIYRFCHRSNIDLDGVPTRSDGPQFTSIIPGPWSLSGVFRSTSSPGTSSRQPPSVPGNVNTSRS